MKKLTNCHLGCFWAGGDQHPFCVVTCQGGAGGRCKIFHYHSKKGYKKKTHQRA